jgi:hypothetical protein
MSRVTTEEHDSAEESDSHLLRCGKCGHFAPARSNRDGELVPAGALGDQCSQCQGDEFEQVVLNTAN